MDAPLCPLCQGPIPTNLSQERLIDCPHCGVSLVRVEDAGWVQLGGTSD